MNDLDSLPLRDIHLPDPISWWPLAPGWWLLLALFILSVSVSVLWRRHQRAHALKKTALECLQFTRKRFYAHGDDYTLLEELSSLMRQMSVSIFPRQEVASLTGQEWLRFLDSCLAQRKDNTQTPFSSGIGKVFADSQYRQRQQCKLNNADAVCLLVEQWISDLPCQNRSSGIRWWRQ